MSSPLWRAWLSEEAAETIIVAARAAHPKETGGVLVGVFNGRRPWVTHAVEVPSGASSGTWFEIEGVERHAAVRAARGLDRDLGYLGEWHSHPADVGPSGADMETMRHLAADPDADCARPVLVIARRAGDEYALDARQIVKVGHRRLRLVASGPLPERGPGERRERRPKQARKTRFNGRWRR